MKAPGRVPLVLSLLHPSPQCRVLIAAQDTVLVPVVDGKGSGCRFHRGNAGYDESCQKAGQQPELAPK